MKILSFALGLLAYSGLTFGTTILPVPLERLVNDADAIVEGTFRSSVTRVLATGEIVTEVSLNLKKIAGLNPNDLYNPEGFKVYYPGGTYNNRIVKVQSAPSFKPGEHVMLMLEKRNFGYLIQNLSLGKFNYHKKAGEKDFFVSSLFPRHSELGKINVDKIENLIQKRFNQKFTVLNPDLNKHQDNIAVQLPQKTKAIRSPSSTSIKSDQKKGSNATSAWSVVGLFVALLFTSFYLRRKKRIK